MVTVSVDFDVFTRNSGIRPTLMDVLQSHKFVLTILGTVYTGDEKSGIFRAIE